MKKIVTYLLISLLVISMTNVILAKDNSNNGGNNNSNNGKGDNDNGNSGSIWTTKNDCGTVQQDVNQYAIGEKVYINGNKFDAGDYEWEIKGLGGSENSQASCDPDKEVASGNYAVNESGGFCFEAYTIANDDCGEYKVGFNGNNNDENDYSTLNEEDEDKDGKNDNNGKSDNYHVDSLTAVVPEFGAVVGVLTILSALGIFFFVRR